MAKFGYDRFHTTGDQWQREHHCSCGRVVRGNGGKSSHRRACDGYYLSRMDVYRAARRE